MTCFHGYLSESYLAWNMVHKHDHDGFSVWAGLIAFAVFAEALFRNVGTNVHL